MVLDLEVAAVRKYALYKGNLLNDRIKDALSSTEFKSKLLAIIRPFGSLLVAIIHSFYH